MSSSGRDDLLDLEGGLPTTAADVAALRRARPAPMSYAEYFDFLARLPHASADELRARGVTAGPPFRLRP